MSEVTERDTHTEQLEVRTSAYEFRISGGQNSTPNRDVSPGRLETRFIKEVGRAVITASFSGGSDG